ncbi:exodeoxyribonuclease VII small subunit [Petroclostridium sp. X23]|uniref:exodeoxyribonuclease VII small subunit n=1 Tax=Petroclostridium sp. X23 TaxID=3045146 RepID=UPI0024AD4934|nr:exodeoxyribonuclease VII small subunit [Petroclostridium sp. X23]WHH59637.1 exodeoxyribonuclease VII small subunit [Petroclostridium sp. X23]
MDFEKSLKQLEDIVRKLEEEELTLEQSMELFQQGVGLSKECSKMLDEAEQKVSLLIKDKSGEISEQTFEMSNIDA